MIGRDNVCRSAFGERLLRLRLAGLPVEIVSAGFMPRRGLCPSAATLAAAARLGVNLSGHSSNALSLRELERADAVILLDQDAEWRLRQMAPDFSAEVVTLPDPGRVGTEGFPAISAALTRLASVIEERFRLPPSPVPGRGEAPASRPQAA